MEAFAPNFRTQGTQNSLAIMRQILLLLSLSCQNKLSLDEVHHLTLAY